MKTAPLILAGLLAFTFARAALADNMAGMTPAPAPAVSAGKTGTSSGVVKAVDLHAGTVTLRHGAIAAFGWPPMTMTFKASPATLLRDVKVGQTIVFDARLKGSAAEITAIRSQ